MSDQGYNMEHGESFDPSEAIKAEAASQEEANRIHWAQTVEQLEARERALSSELGSVVQELEHARNKSARAGRPRW